MADQNNNQQTDPDILTKILTFFFGPQRILNQAANPNSPQIRPNTVPQNNAQQALAAAIAANPNNNPQPDPTAMKVLASPSKNSKKKSKVPQNSEENY